MALISIAGQFARAEYQFTWAGNSNLFQASFEVTDQEMQPGSTFDSSLFTNSISVTSPDGITYHDTGVGSVFGTFGPPFELNFTLWSDNNSSYVNVLDGPPNGLNGIIVEGGYHEQGYWSYTYIPEPSAAALLSFGAAAWSMGRARRSSDHKK